MINRVCVRFIIYSNIYGLIHEIWKLFNTAITISIVKFRKNIVSLRPSFRERAGWCVENVREAREDDPQWVMRATCVFSYLYCRISHEITHRAASCGQRAPRVMQPAFLPLINLELLPVGRNYSNREYNSRREKVLTRIICAKVVIGL